MFKYPETIVDVNAELLTLVGMLRGNIPDLPVGIRSGWAVAGYAASMTVGSGAVLNATSTNPSDNQLAGAIEAYLVAEVHSSELGHLPWDYLAKRAMEFFTTLFLRYLTEGK